jgi:glycosyltransferase involved in cell wall biosynthesis
MNDRFPVTALKSLGFSSQCAQAMVSIAMPVYNGSEHLAEALLSFQKQSYPHFEMTICDNASTDETAEIAQRFAQRDSRFIYSRQAEFLNARDNFIRAYRLTNREHKYFLWACDDNVWDPQFLAKAVEYMERHPKCSVCASYLHSFGPGASRQQYYPMPLAFKKFRLLHFTLERMSIVSVYALMRRSAIDTIKLDFPFIRDYPDRYQLLQLRGLGYFHVIEVDLLAFRTGGLSSTGDDPWVQTVVDNSFGEAELKALWDLPQLTFLEKYLLSLKYCYIALRHNIPSTAYRIWLGPAHGLAALGNVVRPSPWILTERGLQKRRQGN